MTSSSARVRRPTASDCLWAAVGPHFVVTLMLIGGSLVAELHRRGAHPRDALLRIAPYDPDHDRGRFLGALERDRHQGIPDGAEVLALFRQAEADCAVSLRMRMARARVRTPGRSA